MLWQPDFVADIKLLPTANGGRSGPTPAEWFGCPLGYEGEFFDVRFDLTAIGSLTPGGVAIVPGKFLSPELIKHRLKAGSKFTLWEGKTIGDGVVREIVVP